MLTLAAIRACHLAAITEDAHRISKVEQIAKNDETVHLILSEVQIGHANDILVLFFILQHLVNVPVIGQLAHDELHQEKHHHKQVHENAAAGSITLRQVAFLVPQSLAVDDLDPDGAVQIHEAKA